MTIEGRSQWSRNPQAGSNANLEVTDYSVDVLGVREIIFNNANLTVTVTDDGGGVVEVDVEGPTFSDGTHNESSYFVRLVNGLIVSLYSGFAVGITPDWLTTSPAAVAVTGAAGSSTQIPPADHVHPMGILTTKGDLLARSGSAIGRYGVGTNNFVLTADSTATNGFAWKSLPSANAFHGALISLGSDQSINSAGLTIPFDTTQFDTDSYVSGSTLVVPTGLGGDYIISAGVEFLNSGALNDVYNYSCEARLSGGSGTLLAVDRGYEVCYFNSGANNFHIWRGVSKHTVLADGDTIGVFSSYDSVVGSSSTTVKGNSYGTYLGLSRLG